MGEAIDIRLKVGLWRSLKVLCSHKSRNI